MKRKNAGFRKILQGTALVSSLGWVGLGDGLAEGDPLLDLLVKKGVVTSSEAQSLRREMSQMTPGTGSSGGTSGSVAPKTGSVADNELKWFWDKGLKIKSNDKGKTFSGTFGGRIMLDAAVFDADSDVESVVNDLNPGAEFRRVRLHTTGKIGTMGQPVFYKLEVDFAGAEVSFKDVYLGVDKIPVIGSITVGHFKEPFGLEELESSRSLRFLERSMPNEAFSPSRNTGVMIGDSILKDRMTWALGGFVDVGDSGDGGIDSSNRATARITGLPYYDEEHDGRRLVHLGVTGSVINPKDDAFRFRSRPESHLANTFVDTGTIRADQGFLNSLELAGVWGPFSAEAEYMHMMVEPLRGKDLYFHGYTVQAGYFLTGEHRPYSKSKGTWDRLIPHNNFSLGGGGCGAWEVGMRYSSLDLNDRGIRGGEAQNLSGAVSWYLNPMMRVMLNYGYAWLDRGGVEGHAQVVQTRVQVDF